MSALALGSSPARVATVLGWHARSYRSAWRATVSVAFLAPLFFLLSVGVLLGGLVDEGRSDLGGLTYLEFVAPGLLAATAMQIGSGDGSFPVMAGIKWVKTYHAVVATPVRVPELFAGVLAWTVVRMAVATTVFAGIAAAFGAFRSPLAVLAPAAAVLCGAVFASLVASLSAGSQSSAVLTALFRFGILPIFLFSGTFFPVSQLPDWLEPAAWATPLWHGVELCRGLASGTVEAGPALGHVAYLLAVGAAGSALAVRMLRRKLLR